MKPLRNIAAVASRELRLIAGDRWTAIALFVVPLAAGIVLAFIYQPQIVRNVPTIVVDHDGSATSRGLIRSLDANESIMVLRTEFHETDLESTLRRGEADCAVIIPRDFERDLKQGKQAELLCLVNGSNILVANYALKGVTVVAGTVSMGVSLKKVEKGGVPSTHALRAASPLSITSRYLYNPGQNYSNFFLPGVLAALLQQVVVIGAALTWVREKQSNGLAELRQMSASLFQIAAGKLLTYVAIGSGWALVFFAGLFPLMTVPYTGSVAAGAAAVVLMLSAMALLAMMISAIVERKETAMQMAFIMSSPAFLLSGYTFPQIAMAPAVRWLGEIVPLTPFLVAWRRIVLYGGLTSDVWGRLAALCVMAILFGSIMLFVIWRKLADSRLAAGEIP